MPHEKVKEENRQRVFEKAIELCAKHGFEQLNLSQVAKEAKVSVRSLYRYYESKEVLITEIIEREVHNLEKTVIKSMRSKKFQEMDGANQVLFLVDIMLHYVKDNCKLQSRIIAAERYLFDADIPDTFSLYSDRENRITQSFIPPFQKGVKDGSIVPWALDNSRFFVSLAVAFRGYYNRIAMISENATLSEHYHPDYLIEDFLQAIYRTISNKQDVTSN